MSTRVLSCLRGLERGVDQLAALYHPGNVNGGTPKNGPYWQPSAKDLRRHLMSGDCYQLTPLYSSIGSGSPKGERARAFVQQVIEPLYDRLFEDFARSGQGPEHGRDVERAANTQKEREAAWRNYGGAVRKLGRAVRALKAYAMRNDVRT